MKYNQKNHSIETDSGETVAFLVHSTVIDTAKGFEIADKLSEIEPDHLKKEKKTLTRIVDQLRDQNDSLKYQIWGPKP